MGDEQFTHLPPPIWDRSAAVENQSVSRVGAGTFLQAVISNTSGGVRYFQLHDLAVALTGGEVPILTVAIPAGDAKVISLPRNLEFATGLVWGLSTTAATFTAPGAPEGWAAVAVDAF
jgi:hypothetical protein